MNKSLYQIPMGLGKGRGEACKPAAPQTLAVAPGDPVVGYNLGRGRGLET